MKDDMMEEEKESKNKPEMEKWVIVIAMTILAIYLIYTYVSGSKQVEFNIKQELINKMEKGGYAEALERMSNSTEICIVEKLDKTEDPVRRNIMNCGVNIASTAPSYGKNVSAYAIEGGKCYYTGGEKSIESCYTEIVEKGCFVMYIEEGSTFESYSNMLIIGVNETFNEKGCEIGG